MKKMRKMKERIWSLVLTFVMVVSLFTGMAPVEVHAAASYNFTEITIGQKIYPGDIITNDRGAGSLYVNILDRNYTHKVSETTVGNAVTIQNSYTAIEHSDYSITSEAWVVMQIQSNQYLYLVKEADANLVELIEDELISVSKTEGSDTNTVKLNREEGCRYFYQIADVYAMSYPREQPYTNDMIRGVVEEGNPTVSNSLQRTISLADIEEDLQEITGDSFCVDSSAYGMIYKFVKDTDVVGKEDSYLNTGAVYFASEKIARDVTVLGAEHGTVTATSNGETATKVEEVETVNLTLTPDEGYEIGSVSVKDTEGNEISVKEDYSFLMPRSAVTVSVTFAQEGAPSAPITYDITLDRTNYADGYVDLYTYDSEGSNVANTQENNATITMPEGGKVRVFADSEFTVTAEGATISEMLNAGDEGYYYELTGIAADTTVVVNKVVDEPEEGKKIYDTGTKHLYHPRYTYNEETRKFTVLLEKPQAGYEYRVFWTSFPMNPMAPYLDDLDSQYGNYFGMANKVENNSFEVGTGQIVALYYCEKDASSYNSSTVQSVIFGTENDGTLYGGEDRNGTDFKLDIDYELLSTVVENGSLIIPASSSEYTELRNTLKEAIKVPKDATYHTGLDGLYIHEYDPETKTVGAQAGYSSMQAGKKYVYVMYMFGKISANPTSNQEGVEHCKKSNVYYVWYDLSLLAAPEITGQPQDVTVEEGNTATFTVTASGKGLSYQWQVDNGNGFVDIEGATSASYTTSVVDMSYNGFKYQCIVKTSTGSATSNSATLTVTEKAKIVAPAITGQPQNATVEEGQKATFTVTATGDDLSYQWMIDRNDGKGFVNLASTTATHTTTVVDMSCNGFKYKCIVSNSVGAVTSNVVTLTVTEKEVVHTHDLTLVPAKAATCTEEGNKAYYTCSGCDSLFTDAEGTKTTTAEAVKIAALGHDWSGEWTIIKEATATEEGKKETYCTRKCGQKKVAVIPIEGEEDEDAGNIEKDAEVDPEAPVDEATIDNKKEELLEGDIFTEEEKELIEAGEEARVWLEIGKTDEDAIAAEDKAKIEKEAASIMGDDAKITYFDADLFKQVGNGKKTEITEPGVDIKITIIIPEELLNQDKTITREYKIIRLHEGEVDVISGTFDPATGEFSFETDRFSTYAIVYDDVPVDSADDKDDVPVDSADDKDDVPKTGVVSTTSYACALMLLSGLGFVFCSSKKKSNE